jgi:hypothetical protein
MHYGPVSSRRRQYYISNDKRITKQIVNECNTYLLVVGDDDTIYLTIRAPPLLVGDVNATTATPKPGVANPIKGALGAPISDNGDDGNDDAEAPSALKATTVNEKATPARNCNEVKSV